MLHLAVLDDNINDLLQSARTVKLALIFHLQDILKCIQYAHHDMGIPLQESVIRFTVGLRRTKKAAACS